VCVWVGVFVCVCVWCGVCVCVRVCRSQTSKLNIQGLKASGRPQGTRRGILRILYVWLHSQQRYAALPWDRHTFSMLRQITT